MKPLSWGGQVLSPALRINSTFAILLDTPPKISSPRLLSEIRHFLPILFRDLEHSVARGSVSSFNTAKAMDEDMACELSWNMVCKKIRC